MVSSGSMVRRVSILLDDELDKKLRLKQAKLIQKSKNSVSFSKVLNDTVSDGLKKGRAKLGS